MRYNFYDTGNMKTMSEFYDRKACFESSDALFDCFDKFNER